jgi:hypothetical protein
MPRYFEVINLYCAPDSILAERISGRDVYDAAPELFGDVSKAFWSTAFGEMYSRGWIISPKFIGGAFDSMSYNVKVEGVARCWIEEAQRAAFSEDLDSIVSKAYELAQEELDGARKDIAVEQD